MSGNAAYPSLAPPNSAVAYAGVGAPSPSRRASQAQVSEVQAKAHHPYATTTGAIHAPSDNVAAMNSSNGAIGKPDESFKGGYGGRAPTNVSGTAALSQSRNGEVAVPMNEQNGGMHGGPDRLDDERPRRGFLDFLLCRCG